ncbi:hypothetical protein [Borrelia sp. RT5S]|uniref:hypothetical protein n=1 Tax=Borrelia sp. RT5S TaxID=2898581 RepID=UPI001E3B2336|nr:hypothetical protein [Borrelia sp. RT5S]UGQ16385.1 hypothetical protein LSO06_03805 [Borrelia sp. RT5S]
MGIRVISILLLMLFIGSCKWWFEAETEGEVLVKPLEDIKVVATRAVEEVSKATGRSAAEVKALSKEDLDKFALDAKSSADATFEITKDSKNNKKKSEFIDEIKKSAGKLDLAFKSLVGAGYTGPIAGPVISNIESALKNLELAKKLAEMAESGNPNTLEDAKKAVQALGGNTGSCVSNLSSKNGYSEPVKNGLNDCVKNLMDRVNSNFERGVRDQLYNDNLKDVPPKFKDAFDTLRVAAHSMSQAASKVQFK